MRSWIFTCVEHLSVTNIYYSKLIKLKVIKVLSLFKYLSSKWKWILSVRAGPEQCSGKHLLEGSEIFEKNYIDISSQNLKPLNCKKKILHKTLSQAPKISGPVLHSRRTPTNKHFSINLHKLVHQLWDSTVNIIATATLSKEGTWNMRPNPH